MGFCLFREADFPDYFFAVNPAHIESVDVRGHIIPPPTQLRFPFTPEDFLPITSSSYEEVMKRLREGAKIGLKKVEMQALAGSQAMPFLLNNPDRVALVRELRPDEIRKGAETTVASQVYFSNGETRIVIGRPGSFAFLANAGGKVPGI